MSEQKHTPEPWVIEGPNFGAWHIRQNPKDWDGAGYLHICTVQAAKKGTYYGDMFAANARRIVACVNALKGIPTEDLEKYGDAFADGYISQMSLDRLEKERDELKAALDATTAQRDELFDLILRVRVMLNMADTEYAYTDDEIAKLRADVRAATKIEGMKEC